MGSLASIMSPIRHRRNNNNQFHRRLNMRSFHHPSVDLNDYNSYLRPLLPRNYRNYSHLSSQQQHQSNPQSDTGWRHIVWNALNNTASNLRNEIVNVVTTHVVEFGVAVISAYISNFVLGLN